MHEKLDFLNKYDLINEYEEIFFKNGKRIQGKSPSMEEKGVRYLNEYILSFNRYLRVMIMNYDPIMTTKYLDI